MSRNESSFWLIFLSKECIFTKFACECLYVKSLSISIKVMNRFITFLLGLASGICLTIGIDYLNKGGTFGDFFEPSDSTSVVEEIPTPESSTATESDTFKKISSIIKSDKNTIIFDEPEEVFKSKAFIVKEVIDDGKAIAYEATWDDLFKMYSQTDLKVLITNDEGKYYYDNQIIKVPGGKQVCQIGIYKRYSSTIPVVMIMDK